MANMGKISNSRRAYLIDEYIHNKRHRLIMKKHFIDGESCEEISRDKQIDRTPKQVWNIIGKCCAELADFIYDEME